MSDLKTRRNNKSVEDFINSVEDDIKRQDSKKLLNIFAECTKEKPSMWGDSIIGYGSYHYKSKSQEGDWPLTGFSPRKQYLSIYIMPGFDLYKNELDKLGKYKTSVSCLYIKQLADVDVNILKAIIKDSTDVMRKRSI